MNVGLSKNWRLENKSAIKLKLENDICTKKMSPKFIRQWILLIFDNKNWLLKYDFGVADEESMKILEKMLKTKQCDSNWYQLSYPPKISNLLCNT